LVPPLIWRLYVLCVKPELLGRYTEDGDVGGAGRSGVNCEYIVPDYGTPTDHS
jgi:hypothetical protein